MRNDTLVLGMVLLSALTQACNGEDTKATKHTKEAIVADAGSEPVSDAGSGGEDIVDSATHEDRSFARVMEIFAAKCLPCHATTPERPNASGKLDLGTAEAAYAQLVDVPAQGGACASGGGVRVVPGDPDASLLMAKLQNTPGLCGAPMPKPAANQEFTPLSDSELAEVAAWIEAGAASQ